MLDTNMVGHAVRCHPNVEARIKQVSFDALCVSAIVEAELLFGLANAPQATRLAELVRRFLAQVQCLPWKSEVAVLYGDLRAGMQRSGKSLGAHDMLIAAHALSVKALLVTSDQAFRHVPGLEVEDWTGG